MSGFGPVSLSELMFFTSRAAFGAGCAHGVAEDVASVAVWLARRGIDPTLPLAKALDNIALKTASSKLKKSGVEGAIILEASEDEAASAIYGGIALSDQLPVMAGSGSKSAQLMKVDFPILAVAFVKALEGKQSCVGEVANAVISIDKETDLLGATGEGLNVSLGDTPASAALKPEPAINDHHNILVSQEGWEGILKHFKSSLVEATEASRLSGAGAGLVDTD